jgi:hypothetical protein
MSQPDRIDKNDLFNERNGSPYFTGQGGIGRINIRNSIDIG